MQILLDLKAFVFIHICKCGIYGGYGCSLTALWIREMLK